jgi:hypothetical protein
MAACTAEKGARFHECIAPECDLPCAKEVVGAAWTLDALDHERDRLAAELEAVG